MANLLEEWTHLSNDLFNATSALEAAVSIVVARKESGCDSKPDRLLAARLARQRLNAVRAQIDLFLEEHVG